MLENETWEQPEWGAPDFTDPADVPPIPESVAFELTVTEVAGLVSGRRQYRVTVVAGKDRTLRSDAAASYLRMLAAGMPAGGIDVYQRTKAEQEWLYDHQPPRAAPYSATAPHIDNRALDFHTTTGGRYDPSAAFLWVTKGTDGSKAPRYTDDSRMRGHEYGWYRSVPSERWHLEYDRSRDKHRAADLAARLKALGYRNVKAFQAAHGLTADGVDGPLTWGALLNGPIPATPPKDQPVPELTQLEVKVATLNCLDPGIRQGKPPKLHPFTEDRKRDLVKVAVRADADFICATECPQIISEAILAALPGYKVWEAGSQRIIFNAAEWDYSERPKTGKWGYHGFVVATFTHRKTGRKFTIGVYHLPPNSTTPEATQRKHLATFLAEMRRHPGIRIIGGDGMDSASWATGWKDVRLAGQWEDRNKPTYQGRAITDRILVDAQTPVEVLSYDTLSGGKGTDHALVLTTVRTIPTN